MASQQHDAQPRLSSTRALRGSEQGFDTPSENIPGDVHHLHDSRTITVCNIWCFGSVPQTAGNARIGAGAHNLLPHSGHPMCMAVIAKMNLVSQDQHQQTLGIESKRLTAFRSSTPQRAGEGSLVDDAAAEVRRTLADDDILIGGLRCSSCTGWQVALDWRSHNLCIAMPANISLRSTGARDFVLAGPKSPLPPCH